MKNKKLCVGYTVGASIVRAIALACAGPPT